MPIKDTYNTVEKTVEGYFKEKGSKFHSYLYPIENEDEVREILQQLKKIHFSARHHCYAWRLGQEEIRFRANDDGEPSSTAGKPILGQLVCSDITNALCVVVRYFGGTLLGVSGLINAYRQATIEAINNAQIVSRIIELEYELRFTYNQLNTVMHVIKTENLNQTEIDLQESCRIKYSIRKSEAERIKTIFDGVYGVSIKEIC